MSTPETHLEPRAAPQRRVAPPRYYARQARVRGGYVLRAACDAGHPLEQGNVIVRSKGMVCRACENVRVGGKPRVKPTKEHPLEAVKRRLLKVYGITFEDYTARLEKQGGLCAICRKADPLGNGRSEHMPLVVDHDHATGKVRGLLCHPCNVSLGAIERPGFLAAATEYLDGSRS
jgi:hypothetical protein